MTRVLLLLALPACNGLEFYGATFDDKTVVDDALDDPAAGGDADADADSDADLDADTDADTDTEPVITIDTATPGTTTLVDTGVGTTTTLVDTGGGTTTVPPPPPIALDAITPDFGPTSGGTVVTATGTFDATTTLEFDGIAGTILSYTTTELQVQTPPHAVDGFYDVRAVSGIQTDTLPSAYQYWVDGTGQSGTFGWLVYTEIVGGYWSNNPPDSAFGMFAFSDPSTWNLQADYTPALNTCQFNYNSAPVPVFQDPGAASVNFVSGGALANLPADPLSPGLFVQNALVPGVDVVPGSVYDLDPVAGNVNWPGFGLSAIVQIPSAFTVTNPNLDRPTTPPDVTRFFTIDWGGSGGDYVLIYILRQYFDVFGVVHNDGYVTCAVSDTGSFVLPNVWPDWFVDDFLHIQVGRVIENSVVLPHNNATNRMAGIYWYYGGANTIN